VIERGGQPLVFVPANFAEPFSDIVIDDVDTPDSQGFTISQSE
jgi:hypothetical protein